MTKQKSKHINSSRQKQKSQTNKSGVSNNSQQTAKDWHKIMKDIHQLTDKIRSLSQTKKQHKTAKRSNSKTVYKSHSKTLKINQSLNCSHHLPLDNKSNHIRTHQSDYPVSEYLKMSSGVSHKSIYGSSRRPLDTSLHSIHSIQKQNNFMKKQRNPRDFKICLNPKQQNKKQCLTDCHKIMQQMLKIQLVNQKLINKTSELQKKIFFSQIQKKQLLKKIDRSKIDNIINLYNKQNEMQDKQFIRTPKDNKQNYGIYKGYTDISRQQKQATFHDEMEINNYKSIQFKPQTYHNHFGQFSTQVHSLALKASNMNQQNQKSEKKILKKQYLDLSVKKHRQREGNRKEQHQVQSNKQIKKLFTKAQTNNNTRQLNNKKAANAFKDKNSNKFANLQNYFDQLVQISRLQRNKMRKKVIWKEMKQIASQLKQIRQNE